MTCEDCKYWEKHPELDGQCRRLSPRRIWDKEANEIDLVLGIWPNTNYDQWCGEYENKLNLDNIEVENLKNAVDIEYYKLLRIELAKTILAGETNRAISMTKELCKLTNKAKASLIKK